MNSSLFGSEGHSLFCYEGDKYVLVLAVASQCIQC